jgi:hypothetical protein
MKYIVTTEKTSGAIGRPWWRVRRSLWWALVIVCAAPFAIWLIPEYRAALFAALVGPFVEAVQPLLRVDVLVVLTSSTGGGLLIGWVLRRIGAWRPPEPSVQVA